MPEVMAGAKAPDFSVETDQGPMSLSDLLERGKLVLAFYYEDMTPTCSTQVSSLKEGFDTFEEMGATVLAVSSDSLESHKLFYDRLGGVPFPLASDTDLALARAYGVVDESGKRARRAVFVIDADGTVLLALPQYNPANLSQFEQVFTALGA
ncbi:MAG TPA: redoxin domain-containing protein [Dehalococcoidia bacterium]